MNPLQSSGIRGTQNSPKSSKGASKPSGGGLLKKASSLALKALTHMSSKNTAFKENQADIKKMMRSVRDEVGLGEHANEGAIKGSAHIVQHTFKNASIDKKIAATKALVAIHTGSGRQLNPKTVTSEQLDACKQWLHQKGEDYRVFETSIDTLKELLKTR